MSLDPNHERRVLSQRAKDKALAQAQARHIAQAADQEGKVKVWDVKTGQCRVLWAVDARDAIERGAVTLEPPAPAEEPLVVEPPTPEPTVGGQPEGQPEDPAPLAP